MGHASISSRANMSAPKSLCENNSTATSSGNRRHSSTSSIHGTTAGRLGNVHSLLSLDNTSCSNNNNNNNIEINDYNQSVAERLEADKSGGSNDGNVNGTAGGGVSNSVKHHVTNLACTQDDRYGHPQKSHLDTTGSSHCGYHYDK